MHCADWASELKTDTDISVRERARRSCSMLEFETKPLTAEYDYLAPDGSEIRLLPVVNGGGLAHCTLPPGRVSAAAKHRSVEEIWCFVQGQG
jgi:hypothetical protein